MIVRFQEYFFFCFVPKYTKIVNEDTQERSLSRNTVQPSREHHENVPI